MPELRADCRVRVAENDGGYKQDKDDLIEHKVLCVGIVVVQHTVVLLAGHRKMRLV